MCPSVSIIHVQHEIQFVLLLVDGVYGAYGEMGGRVGGGGRRGLTTFQQYVGELYIKISHTRQILIINVWPQFTFTI